jgi:hypothetical protein
MNEIWASVGLPHEWKGKLLKTDRTEHTSLILLMPLFTYSMIPSENVSKESFVPNICLSGKNDHQRANMTGQEDLT